MTRSDDIAAWLVGAGQAEATMEGLVQGFADRLLDRGFPISQIVMGAFTSLPDYSAFGYRWTAGGGGVVFEPAGTVQLTSEQFRHALFDDLLRVDLRFRRIRPAHADPSPTAQALAIAGTTDYCLFREPFEPDPEMPLWVRPNETVAFNEGIIGSVSTRHAPGFTDGQVENLRWYFSLLCLFMRGNTGFELARAILCARTG